MKFIELIHKIIKGRCSHQKLTGTFISIFKLSMLKKHVCVFLFQTIVESNLFFIINNNKKHTHSYRKVDPSLFKKWAVCNNFIFQNSH